MPVSDTSHLRKPVQRPDFPGILGIQGNPQLWLRTIALVVLTAVAIAWVVMYALKVKKNPEASPAFHDDIEKRKEFVRTRISSIASSPVAESRYGYFRAWTCRHHWGLVAQGWYMNEISAIFLAMALLSGVVSGMNEKEIAGEFVKGIADFAFSAIVVGLARGILVIANDGLIIDTILNTLVTALTGVPAVIFTSILYVVDNLLSILVPSSSGIAALTIPIFGPLVELMGLNPRLQLLVFPWAARPCLSFRQQARCSLPVLASARFRLASGGRLLGNSSWS